MYVVWKTRHLSSSSCHLCGRGGSGRFAIIPHLVASRRVGGRPSQMHLARLPSIRSCCLHSDVVVRKWWQQVDAALIGVRLPGGHPQPLTADQARELRRKLEDGLGRFRAEGGPERNERPQDTAPRHLASPLRMLRLSWPCRADEIKSAFRRRAKETHPDAGGRPEDFRAVYEAYSTLLKVIAGPLR